MARSSLDGSLIEYVAAAKSSSGARGSTTMNEVVKLSTRAAIQSRLGERDQQSI